MFSPQFNVGLASRKSSASSLNNLQELILCIYNRIIFPQIVLRIVTASFVEAHCPCKIIYTTYINSGLYIYK